MVFVDSFDLFLDNIATDGRNYILIFVKAARSGRYSQLSAKKIMLCGSRIPIIVQSQLCEDFAFIIITAPSKQIDSPITKLSCFRCFDWLGNEIKQQKALSKQ